KASAAVLIAAVTGARLLAQQASGPRPEGPLPGAAATAQPVVSAEMAQAEAQVARIRELVRPRPGEHVTNLARIAWEHDPWEAAAPRLVAGDTGGPDGKNNPLAPKRLRAILEKFKQLPPEKRLARVEDLPTTWKGKALPQPPAGGLILRQYRRIIHRDAEGR